MRRDWNRYPYAFLSLAIDIPFLCLLRVCGKQNICTYADDGGCCAPNVYFTGQVCGDQGDVAKTCALCICSKAGIEYILSHET